MLGNLKKLSQTDIIPSGWLRRQLILQAKGLTGNIDKLFPDLSDNSAWLGGKGEAWERGPYYLDGLIPLAFLLQDDILLKKVNKWVEAILASNNSTVGFGPARNKDYWPRMVVQKALISYFRATGDKRIIHFLTDYYHFMLEHIDATPPYYWASARALEGMEAMTAVYEITGESFILELIEKLKIYSYDWWDYFTNFKFTKPTSKYTNRSVFKLGKAIAEPIDAIMNKSEKIPKTKTKKEIEGFNNNSLVKLISLTHGVNIAMAYKYPVTYGVFKNDSEMIALGEKGYETVMKYHGLANGLHSSDEHLMGFDASGGVELCTVVEAAYSFEEMLRLTENNKYADIVESLIFNALPATFSQDMTAHQYVQLPNQIAADKKSRQFFDTDNEANIFGIAPNFGCCAANFHQGFPKFAENLVYKNKKGLCFFIYAPCEIATKFSGKNVKIKEITDYPFDDKVTFEINQAENLQITFRIPSFTEKVLFNNGEIKFDSGKLTVTVMSGDKIELIFSGKLSVTKNADESISIRKNNLLLAMPLEAEERFVRGVEPFHYREYITEDKFNFSPVIVGDEPVIIKKTVKESGEVPFERDKPVIKYIVKGKEILNWKKSYNSAKSPPKVPLLGEDVNITLVPYGATYLRIAQFAEINE